MSEFLTVAIDAARKAEEVIMRYYSDDIRATLKEDQSPVTVADTEAERVIVEILRTAFPRHGFLGEESGSSDRAAEYVWIIDPVDGTKNYVRKIPIFGTQIALMKNGELILGVSNAPALKEFAYAERGSGAYLNDAKLRVSPVTDLRRAYASFGNLQYFEEQRLVPQLLALVKTVNGRRGFGDFWAFHLLAQGKIDIVVEAHVKIWDIAAAKVIVEEAGGAVTDIVGGPIEKDTTTVIATNGALHEDVVRFFAKQVPA